MVHLIVATIEAHADDTGGNAAHRADIVLVEADGTTIAVGQQELVLAVGQTNAHHSVALVDIDGDHTVGTRT